MNSLTLNWAFGVHSTVPAECSTKQKHENASVIALFWHYLQFHRPVQMPGTVVKQSKTGLFKIFWVTSPCNFINVLQTWSKSVSNAFPDIHPFQKCVAMVLQMFQQCVGIKIYAKFGCSIYILFMNFILHLTSLMFCIFDP